jgi:hypothetical protein
VAAGEIDLLRELAKGRRLGGLAGVDAAARQRPLPAVSAQLRHASGQEQARAAVLVRHEHDGHRGRAPALQRRAATLEAGEVRARPREQRVVEGAQRGGV